MLGINAYSKLKEDLELVETALPVFEQEDFLEEIITPVFFGSAITNFGIENFLQYLIDLAPEPQGMQSNTGIINPDAPFFSGFVYKMQANMNKQHRDRISFLE